MKLRCHFGAHWILNGVPKSTMFQNNLKREKGGPRNGFEKTWFVDWFLMLKWEAWNDKKKKCSHYTCCKLGDLGGQENWSKKWCQKSTKLTPESSFGHPGIWFLRFWEGLIEVRFLMNFWAAKKLKRTGKMRRRCEKRISAGRVGGRGGVPEELLESANR